MTKRERRQQQRHRAVLPQPDEQPKSGMDAHHTTNKTNVSAPIASAEYSVLHAAIQEMAAERNQRKSGENKATFIASCALVISTLGAFGSIWQGAGTSRSVDAQIRQSSLDQRAWVSVTRFQLLEDLEENKLIGIKLWLANTGKTPAVDMGYQGTIYIGGQEPTLPFDELHRLGAQPQLGQSHLTVMPTGQSSLTSIDHQFKLSTATTFLNNHTIPELLAGYRAGQMRFYILERIEYRDVFGGAQWLEVCASHGFGELLDQFAFCPTRNRISATTR